MSGPPSPPPDTPSLTAYPTSDSSSYGGQEGKGTSYKGEALIRIFYEIEKSLDSIAQGAPSCAEEIDTIKSMLKDVRTNVIQERAGKYTGSITPDLTE